MKILNLIFVLLFGAQTWAAAIAYQCDDHKRLSHIEFSAQSKDQLRKFASVSENKEVLPEDLMIKTPGGYYQDIMVFYPYYSNYMYVTGVFQFDKPVLYSHTYTDVIQRETKDAMSMGLDPYALLSVGLMESAGGSATLYLDPVAQLDNLGCKGRKSPVQSFESHVPKVYSYATMFEFEPALITNPELSQKLTDFVSRHEQEAIASPLPGIPESAVSTLKAGKSFFCYPMDNRFVLSESKQPELPGSFHPAPQSDMCCIQVGFEVVNDTLSFKRALKSMERALAITKLRRTLETQRQGETDPAFRVQYYNGYTALMGIKESVPAFRAGINYYVTPAYGYQTMDFMINSLLMNPAINQIIKENEQTLLSENIPSHYESLLCKDKGAGTFEIDSDYYFSKHRDAPRLVVIYEKFKKSMSWKNLEPGERKVMALEYTGLLKLYNKNGCTNPEAEVFKTMIETFVNNDMTLESGEPIYQYYFTKIYATRDTVGKASDYPWRLLNDDEMGRLSARIRLGSSADPKP